MASSQEAICRDNDKILTLELRKCSERRTDGWGNDARDTEGETERRREKDGEYIFCVIYWPKLSAKIFPKDPNPPLHSPLQDMSFCREA